MSLIYLGILFCVGILLFFAGIRDFRKREISRRQILILTLICLIGIPFKTHFGLWNALGGAAVGLCIVGISIASRGQIGRGDGMVLGAIGLLLGHIVDIKKRKPPYKTSISSGAFCGIYCIYWYANYLVQHYINNRVICT